MGEQEEVFVPVRFWSCTQTAGSLSLWMCIPQGASFGTITGMTDKFEGCVVREMRRLDELMKNLHLAAKVTNHSQTYTKALLA